MIELIVIEREAVREHRVQYLDRLGVREAIFEREEGIDLLGDVAEQIVELTAR